MIKRKTGWFLAATIVIASLLFVFVSCGKTPSQSPEGGEEAKSLRLQTNESGVFWESVGEGASCLVSTDGAPWVEAEGTSVSFSEQEGNHTIRVKVAGASDSDPDSIASITYYSTPISLSDLTFKGLKAVWVASAKTIFVKEDGGDYRQTDLSSYELTELTAGDHTVSVKACGGYDAERAVYYYGDEITKSASKTIALASLNLTFSDGVGSGSYVSEDWKQYNHGTGNSMTGQMNSRYDAAGDKIANMVATSSYYRYVYKPTSGNIGVANYMTLRIGNYFSASTDISYKILLKDTAGEFRYMTGTPNSAPVCAKSSENGVLRDLCFAFFDPVEVEEIWFLVYSYNPSNTYSYLYFDDLRLQYETPLATTVEEGFSVLDERTITTSESASLGSKATVANLATFSLKNNNSSKQTVTVTLYGQEVNDAAAIVASGVYFLKENQAATIYNLAFNESYVSSYKVEVVSSGTASVNLASFSVKKDAAYLNNADAMACYRVESDATNARSIKLFGEELVGKSSLSLYSEAIKRLEVFASDISPLFTSIGGGVTILSAAYDTSEISLAYLYDGVKYQSSIAVSAKTAANLMVNNGKDNVNYKISSDVQFSKSAPAHGILFCGSSSMEKWVTFAMDMRGYDAADVGIGGTKSTDWLSGGASLAERLIYPFNPSKIVLFVGVNDLKEGASVSDTYDHLTALFAEIHEHLPQTEIYYVLINLVPNTEVQNAYVTELNAEVSGFADEHSYLDVIEIPNIVSSRYNAAKPYVSSFCDTMHLNEAGYTQWAYQIRKKILGA